MNARRAGLRAGFTLIELMVAVAIIGLSMTIVFLKVDTLLPGSRLEAAAKKIVTDLELMRSQAIFSGLTIHLEYDIGFHSYRAYYPVLFDEDNNVIGAGETVILEPSRAGEKIEIEHVAVGFFDESESESAALTINIRPDGSLTGHIVHLFDPNSKRKMSIRIASLTGFAEILEGKVSYQEVSDDSF